MRFYCPPHFKLLSARKRKGDGDFDIVAARDKCLGTYGMKLSGWGRARRFQGGHGGRRLIFGTGSLIVAIKPYF